MEYFIISQDKRVLNAVEPMGITKQITKEMLKKENLRKLGDLAIQCDIKENRWKQYIDFIENPISLVSDNLKEILKKYEEKIFLRPVVLADIKELRQDLYWLIIPESVDCLSPKSEFNKDGSIKKLIIDEKKIGYSKIFKVQGVIENLIIIRLDLAESLLRRDFTGIRLKKVEKES